MADLVIESNLPRAKLLVRLNHHVRTTSTRFATALPRRRPAVWRTELEPAGRFLEGAGDGTGEQGRELEVSPDDKRQEVWWWHRWEGTKSQQTGKGSLLSWAFE